MANVPLKSITFPGLSDTYTIPQIDDTLATAGKAADAKVTGDQLSDLKSAFTTNEITVDTTFNWSNGYVNSSGVVTSSTASQYALVPLVAGQTIHVGTRNTNITIIGTTESDSVSVGDSVTVVQKTSNVNQFESYTYTASKDTNVVISVRASEYEAYVTQPSAFALNASLSGLYGTFANEYDIWEVK